MKILLTGKNGQVGFELQRTLAPLGDIVAVDQADCDFADAEGLRELVRSHKPAIIVNPAAYTAVDKAESEPNVATAINTIAPAILGEEAAKLNAFLIHYSTDYVFDGNKTEAYVESDRTNPKNVYGRSKRDGEQALQESGVRNLILRTSWVVGAHGNNFAKTILRLATERETLSVVSDQIGAPTSAGLLSDLTAHLVRLYQRSSKHNFPYGLYHVAAGGETNWCEYARFVINRAIQAGRPIRVAKDSISEITTSDYPTPADRPANSRLNTSHFKQTFGFELPHWQQGLDHILQRIL